MAAPHSAMVPAAEIFGPRLSPVPWPSSSASCALALDALPVVEGALEVDLVAYFTLALLDRDEELRAVRAVLSAALAKLYAHHQEHGRLQASHDRLREEYRAVRVRALCPSEGA